MDIKILIKTVLAVLSLVFLSGTTLSAFSIYPVILVVIVYCVFTKYGKNVNLHAKMAGSVFGIFSVISTFQVNVYDELLSELPRYLMVVKLAVIFAGVYCISSVFADRLYRLFDGFSLDNRSKMSARKIFLLCFIALTLLYLPVWLMEYPSNVSPDTLSQIKQILNGLYVNHHPFAHTMWLKLLMSFSKDINIRIGIAAFIQMITNAAVFSYVIAYITSRSKSLILFVFSFCFYGLLSFNAFFSITLMKDVTHAVITCLTVVTLIRCYNEKSKNSYVFLSVLLTGFCLFRSNGFYACFIVLLAASAVSIYKRSFGVPLAVFVSLVLSAIIKGPLYHMIGVGDASLVEMLSIPVQQIAFTIRNGGYITNDQYALLNKIVDVSKVHDSYDFFLSDPIKNLINDFGNLTYLKNNALAYFKLWINIGIHNPITYIRAWVNQVSLLFSPHYYSTSIFWTICQNDIGITGSRLLISSELSDSLHMLAYYQHNIPLIGWFHYQSFTTYVMVVLFFYILKEKKWESAVVFSIFFGILITLCLSSPYNLCFRYYYSVVACVPLMIFVALRRAANING